jgi:hypothetical protein
VDSSAAGFSGFRLQPQIVRDGPVHFAKAEFQSPYGPIRSHWYWKDARLCYDLTVPPNTIAAVQLPISNGQVLQEGGKSLDGHKNVFAVTQENQAVSFRVRPGNYQFMLVGP